MRITFVTDTYTPQANGVATTLNRLVNGLRDRGHEVDVIRPAVLACDEAGLGVPSVSLPGYPEIRIGLPMRLMLQARWHRKRPDVIYVATESPLGGSAVSAARALGVPAATGFHTNFQQYVAHYQMPVLERATMSYLRRMHNRSDRTFAPSTDVLDELGRQGFENLALLPKGVDTKMFHPKKRDPLLRAKWGVTGSAPVGIYVGRIAAEKNLDLVARTYAHLQRNIPDFRGVFVGDGPRRKDMMREYPQFIFAGVRYGEDLARHYASADLFVFASVTETFGNVVLEAMASGLAAVAFDYAAARQHILDGLNGFKAPFGDGDAFRNRVLEAANAPDLPEVREAARRTAKKVRWTKVVKRFEKSLKQMIENLEEKDRDPGAVLASEL